MLLVGVAVISANAPLEGQARGQMQLVWAIEPNPQASSGARLYNDGELILKNRLLPVALTELRQDSISEERGSLSVLSGTQLYSVGVTSGARGRRAYAGRMVRWRPTTALKPSAFSTAKATVASMRALLRTLARIFRRFRCRCPKKRI